MAETLKHKTLRGTVWSSIERFSVQGIMFPTGFRLEQPLLTALVKHCADENLPKCLGIVEVADLAFAFIVPVSDDTVDYTDSNLLLHLADSIPPFDFTQGWQHLDYSSTTPKELRHKLRFVTTPKPYPR